KEGGRLTARLSREGLVGKCSIIRGPPGRCTALPFRAPPLPSLAPGMSFARPQPGALCSGSLQEVGPMWQTLRLVGRALRQKWVLRKGPEQIRALQQRRLRSLVGWARARSPFHAERLGGFDPERFELRQLPTLTKTEMMEHFDHFLTDRALKRAELEE